MSAPPAPPPPRQHVCQPVTCPPFLFPSSFLSKRWDTCREVPVIEDEHTPWKLIKLLKFISLCLVFIIVFGTALCSKVSWLAFGPGPEPPAPVV